jgi:hypothetical protein
MYGEVTLHERHDHYMCTLKKLHRTFRERAAELHANRAMLVVNCFGWLSGAGWELTMRALDVLRPHQLIMLHSARHDRQPLPVLVGAEVAHLSLFLQSSELELIGLHRNIVFEFPVMPHTQLGSDQQGQRRFGVTVTPVNHRRGAGRPPRTLTSSQLRALRTLTAMSPMFLGETCDKLYELQRAFTEHTIESLLHIHSRLYRTPWPTIAIYAPLSSPLHEDTIMAVLNCSLVALCRVDKNDVGCLKIGHEL